MIAIRRWAAAIALLVLIGMVGIAVVPWIA